MVWAFGSVRSAVCVSMIWTLGVAFWTLNYSTLFYCTIILIILRWERASTGGQARVFHLLAKGQS